MNTGEKNPFFGKSHTETSIEKMRKAKAGEKNPFFGKSHTEATKRKLRKPKTRGGDRKV